MSVEKTHFRKAFVSPYLSSADIVGPTVLTIASVRLEKDATKITKDDFNTAYFTEQQLRPGEPLKPMILNATNSKTLAKLVGSPWIDDWCNVPVTVYVDESVKFGRDTVSGLRISPEPPRRRPEVVPGTTMWTNAIAAFRRDGNLDAVLERADISTEHRAMLIAEASA